MDPFALVGCLSETNTLVVRGQPIRVRSLPDDMVGHRVKVVGYPARDSHSKASYIKVTEFYDVEDKDSNYAVLRGKVRAFYPPRVHPKYGVSSACVLELEELPASCYCVFNGRLARKATFDVGAAIEVCGFVTFSPRGLQFTAARISSL